MNISGNHTASYLREHTILVRETAAMLGFDHCGIARAERLDEDARRLETWLAKGMHGGMKYMENHFELRVDPGKLVPGARSVITLLINYFPEQEQKDNSFKVSRYAYGKDYHLVIRNRLNTFLRMLEEKTGPIQGRGFVDSAPVLERSWAVKSGLGWVGRNGNLIHKGKGSYFFIATLITDLALLYDDPFAADYCGTCRKCIDACPTDAILDNRVVDGSKCISYFTIELKEATIPDSFAGKFGNWVFGCDICQEVCPWNRFSSPHHDPELAPRKEIMEFAEQDWERLTEEHFKVIFRDSPIKRAGYEGLRRNIKFIADQNGQQNNVTG